MTTYDDWKANEPVPHEEEQEEMRNIQEGDFVSERHSHEPTIPPTLDSEGSCLICSLIFQRDRLAEALRKIFDVFEYCGGGDTWERERCAEDIEFARAALAALGEK